MWGHIRLTGYNIWQTKVFLSAKAREGFQHQPSRAVESARRIATVLVDIAVSLFHSLKLI